MQDFFDYVKGVSDTVPQGYTEKGLKVYRYLVYLGVEQMIENCFPQLKETLPEEDYKLLIESFIRDFTFTSPYYYNLEEDFKVYLQKNLA